jgi:cell wall-associated NlpC family hydrolase
MRKLKTISAYINPYRRIILAGLLVALLALSSCSKRQFPSSEAITLPSVTDRELQAFLNSGTQRSLSTGRKKPNQIIRTAEKYLGTPHCMGGITKKCMDCSGLTYASFSEHNITLPRRSQDQARYGRIIINTRDLRRGDLVFFTRSYNTTDYITHVGIYLGNNQFIHASTSAGVTVTKMDNTWWRTRFVFGTRVF